jgi:hypothetical protein
LLKALARKSGMPVIDAGDAAVWYGSAYAMVHTDKAVTAAVELPAGFSGIVEYPDLKYVPASKGKIIRQLAPAETWMFYLKK